MSLGIRSVEHGFLAADTSMFSVTPFSLLSWAFPMRANLKLCMSQGGGTCPDQLDTEKAAGVISWFPKFVKLLL
jgi:hypothetical protein